MDELQLLRELTEDVPRPSADRLAPARARLRAEIAQETAPSPVRRRMVWAAAVAVGVAAASVAVVGITGTTGPAPAPPTEVAAGPEQVLRAAAVAARAHPVAAPSDNQFIYTKMVRQGGITTESWASVDGTRDGRSIDEGRAFEIGGCRDGKRKVDDGYDRCLPYRAYRPDLPADAAGMLAYLHEDTRGEGTGDNNVKAEAMLLLQTHLPAASRAAILEVLATMPGVIVRPEAVDPIGRPAIGVDPVIGGFTGDEFFLDPADYHYLGRAGLGAVVASGVVNEVGELP